MSTDTVLVAKDDPLFRKFPADAAFHGDGHGLICEESMLVFRRDDGGVFEAPLLERLLPRGGGNQGMTPSNLDVGESPPSVRQSKDQIDESQRNGALQQHQHPAGR